MGIMLGRLSCGPRGQNDGRGLDPQPRSHDKSRFIGFGRRLDSSKTIATLSHPIRFERQTSDLNFL